MPPPIKVKDAKKQSHRAIAQSLNRWFLKNARVLPWRERPQPYSVWLSEVMLQLTQVATVLPYFKRFKTRFPTVTDLANASIDDVYALWAGLGYYSRARNLHKGARAIQARIENGDGFPSTRDEWLAIPGVGEYTAGAVCSIAFNQREAIVDGNVVRVLSRVFSIGKLDAKKSEIWNLARLLVAVKSVEPRMLNQALMELGALVCKPKNPKCKECPLFGSCLGKDLPDRYPPPKPKKEWLSISEEKWVITTNDRDGLRVFLIQNTSKQWREGLWDFPNPRQISIKKAKLIREISSKYVVTIHRVSRKHFLYEITNNEAFRLEKGKWFRLNELPAVPSPVKKFLVTLV